MYCQSFTKFPKGTLRDGCTLEAEVSVQLGWWAVSPGARASEQRKQWKERGVGPAKGRLVTHFEVYGSPAGAVVKTPPASAGDTKTWVRSLGQEDPLEEGTATPSSILAWRIAWTEEPSRLQFIGSQSRTWLSTHTVQCECGAWCGGLGPNESNKQGSLACGWAVC